MMADVHCPYCDAGNEVNHDDGFGYEEDRRHEMECCECEKNFVFTTYIHFSYTPHKADCLNGAPHQLKPSLTWPREYTKMECQCCDYTRKMTPEEFAALEGIG
jgi:hypothetical protein